MTLFSESLYFSIDNQQDNCCIKNNIFHSLKTPMNLLIFQSRLEVLQMAMYDLLGVCGFHEWVCQEV